VERRTSPPLLFLFFFSGISGLVYEVVWFRMLIRTFGVTVYAVSTVLAVYMAGLAAGSLLIGRWRRGQNNPLRLYGIVELLIGASAFVCTRIMVGLPSVYHATPEALRGGPLGQTLLRVGLAALVLAPPTVLMGATLPLISSYLASRKGALGKQVGVLYGANTLGAVVGVMGSGFLALAIFGEQSTVLIAVLINLSVGALALLLSRRDTAGETAPVETHTEENPLARPVLLVYAVSGFCALSYEVVWSRILSLLLGNSVYGFSLMLGSYLVGIGLGSLVMSRWVDRVKRPLFVLALLEVVVSVLALGSLYVVTSIGLRETDLRFTYSQVAEVTDFGRMALHALVIVVPVTLLLGAMFPVASRLCARRGESAEQSVGRLYGYNTIGAIFGSFVTGFILFLLLGTLLSFMLACAISCGLGIYLLMRSDLPRKTTWALASGLVFVCILSVSFRDPFYTILRARIDPREKTLANREDPSATITLTAEAPTLRHLYINGIHTSDSTNYLGDLLVGLPLVFQEAPKKSLIIGLGEGDAFSGSVTAGINTTVADLQPSVVELFKRFTPDAEKFWGAPNAHIVIADGRNVVLGSKENQLDLVVVDGTPPVFASGMVNLYSREFVHLVRTRLTKTGVFLLWFPTVCFESDFWMIARNFADEFKQIAVWTAPQIRGIILLGSSADQPIFDADEATLAERLKARPSRDHILTPEVVKKGFVLTSAELREKAMKFPNVTDDRPFTEFPLFQFWRHDKYWYSNKFLYDYAKRLRVQ
jgi:spermidine synthase